MNNAIIRFSAALAACLMISGCSAARNPENTENTLSVETAAETAAESRITETETEETEDTSMTEPEKIELDLTGLSQREALWVTYFETQRRDATRMEEDSEKRMTWGGVTMKYGLQVIGEPDENGLYPLYIALHGGGSDETGEINEDQWRQMSRYYLDEVKSGVYVNPRAVRNTWDCHSNPESFPLYDRLIENMILFHNVDPNRVYLLGFSAGGDGVYQISPRMADRFAAVNMSAGHPNGIKLENLYNTPIQLQVGLNDEAYGRNTETAKYGVKLDDLQKKYGGGYIHRVNIHIDRGHNFADYDSKDHMIVEDYAGFSKTGEYTGVKAKTGAVSFLNQYTRNPLPETIVWNLGVRADQREVESFYWLSAPLSTDKGIIRAEFSRENNSVTIETDGKVNGDFSILLSTEMFDFDKKITVTIDGVSRETIPEIHEDIMEKTLNERGDPSYIFEDMISSSEFRSE